MSLDNVNKLLIGNIPSELSELISYNIDRAIQGVSSQFIYGLDAYLKEAKTTRDYYIKRGKEVILDIVESNPKAKIDINMLNDIPDSYYIFNGALEDGVLIGFDMEKEGCPRALYTRNFKVIRELSNMGCIVNADKIDKAELSVRGTKTLNALKNIEDVAIGVARLDFEGIVDGKKMYKVVVPQQALRVGLNNPVLMTPLKAMYILGSKLDYILSNRIVRYTETTREGVKQSVVSNNKEIVKKVYVNTDVDKRFNLIEPGYNYNLLRYFAYNLESSVYSKGYSTFRPEMLDRLELVRENEIDKSRHNIDYRLLSKVYEDKIKGLTLSDTYGIKFFDLSPFSLLDDKVDALLTYGLELRGSELYTIMKQNPAIFGDIASELKIAETKVPQIVKDLKVVELPNVEQFKDMVSKGLVRVSTVTKKGKVLEVCVSNNKGVLTEMLGKDYIRDYESVRYKYKEFKKILETKVFKNSSELEQLALEYGVDVGIVVNNIGSNFSGDVSAIIKTIDSKVEELSAKKKIKVTNPMMATVRNVYARGSKDLYITLDVSQIKQIEYSPVV